MYFAKNILDYEVLCRARNRHLSKHEMRPELGRISWKICSYGGIIHPVEKVGVTNHPGANGIELEWQGHVNPTKKLEKRLVFDENKPFRLLFWWR